ncbi:hypothetical protein [Luteolibacter sp. AS25]|uniref:hypothetical protein n=1 Tax=Luteolibacter sp. AS25 TaxID=3135776 RepID=UPI00398B8170
MAETEQKPEVKRRWSGFVCPECRFIFRIPRDHDGSGVVCPSCRRVLRIPGEGDETAPLTARIQKIEFSQDVSPEVLPSQKERHRKGGKGGTKPSSDGGSKIWSVLRSIFLIVGAIALIALATIFLVREIYYKEKGAMPAIEELGEVDDFDDLIAVPLVPPAEKDSAE